MKSKYMTLGTKDFIWGLIYSISSSLVPLGKVFAAGEFPSGKVWFSCAMTAVVPLSIYLAVHFFKNSNGSVGPEK